MSDRNNYTLSLVIPVFHEANQLIKNIHIIKDILDSNSIRHEIILVDDGSLDNTWEVVKALSQ